MAKLDQKKGEAPRAWQRMLSGRRLNILDPSPLDVEIEDIAHGLARVARWNGQTTGSLPFNVAHHSVMVLEICRRIRPGWPVKWQLAALLHDAPEYVIGDMISPFKAALGAQYQKIEHGLQQAIHLRFALPPDLPETIEKTIKRADRVCAFYEAQQIAGFSLEESRKLFGTPRNTEPMEITALDSEASQALFLQHFDEIFRAHTAK